jgi:hypothetical protein
MVRLAAALGLLLQADPANFTTAGRKSTTLGAIRWVREKGGSVKIEATDGRKLSIELKSEGKAKVEKVSLEVFMGKFVSEDKSRFAGCMFILADTPEPWTFKFRQFSDLATWKINDTTWRAGKLPAFDFGADGGNAGEWGAGPDTNTVAFTDNPGSWGVKEGFVEPRFENHRYKRGDAYEYTLHLKTIVYANNKAVAVVDWKFVFTAKIGECADVSAKTHLSTQSADIVAAVKRLEEASKNGRLGESYVK